jgi:hypothetical protein
VKLPEERYTQSEEGITPTECARRLKCSVKTLYRSQVPYHYIGRKRVYFWDEVRAFFRSARSVA